MIVASKEVSCAATHYHFVCMRRTVIVWWIRVVCLRSGRGICVWQDYYAFGFCLHIYCRVVSLAVVLKSRPCLFHSRLERVLRREYLAPLMDES